MTVPSADRPFMPGYGIEADADGMLPWDDVESRLAASPRYWLATVWPGEVGVPHLMPVWALWIEGALWFSSSNRSRKARNLDAHPRCSVSTDDPLAPIVVEGTAERRTDLAEREAVVAAMNTKYDVEYDVDFLDPDVNATFRVRPEKVLALTEAEFTASPTRFTFS